MKLEDIATQLTGQVKMLSAEIAAHFEVEGDNGNTIDSLQETLDKVREQLIEVNTRLIRDAVE